MQQGNPCTLWVGMFQRTAPVGNCMASPPQIKIELPYDPAIPFLYIFKIIEGSVSKRYLHTYVLSDVTHNCRKVRATEILGKNNAIFSSNIVFALRKGSSAIWHNMNEL